MTTKCAGLNCRFPEENHSPECIAEHAASAAGGRFVPSAMDASGQKLTYPEPAYSWLPIESAPRDGSNILIRFGRDGVSQAKYVAGTPFPWKFIDTHDGITWMINTARDGEYGPSHWMPLPSAVGPEPDPRASSATASDNADKEQS